MKLWYNRIHAAASRVLIQLPRSCEQAGSFRLSFAGGTPNMDQTFPWNPEKIIILHAK